MNCLTRKRLDWPEPQSGHQPASGRSAIQANSSLVGAYDNRTLSSTCVKSSSDLDWNKICFSPPSPQPQFFCYLMFLHLLSPFRGHILLGKWLLWDKSPGAFKSIGSVLKGKCSFLSCVRILPLFELPPRNDSGKLLFLQNGLCLLLQMCFFSSGKLFLMKSFS